MLKFWSFLIGKDWEVVKFYRSSSQDKVKLFGSIILIPVILWAANGYLMSREIFESGVISSLLVGVVLGFIIYLIERSILLAESNPVINRLRILLGVIVAVLGSLTMDEVIFKNDIDQMMYISKIEDRDQETSKCDRLLQQRDSVNIQVNASKELYDKSVETYNNERYGKTITGKVGYGSEAKRNEREMLVREKDWQRLVQISDELNSEWKDCIKSAVKDNRENFNDKGLLMRMKALFKLILSDWVSFTVFFLYFSLVLIMELLVIIMKKFVPTSPDEELEKIGDKLFVSKFRKWLQDRKDNYDLDL